MDYSLHYDDELTITGKFSDTVSETQAFEFLEFFKEHACLDPVYSSLAIRYEHTNDQGCVWYGVIWLGPNNLLGGDMTTSYLGSWDSTPIEELYPSVIDTFMVNVKAYPVYR